MGPRPAGLALGALAFLAAALALGCGRRATEGDCALIFDRVVEMELRSMKTTDAAIIAKKQGELRTSMKDELRDCQGRRVTDGMLVCVKQAESSDAVFACLR